MGDRNRRQQQPPFRFWFPYWSNAPFTARPQVPAPQRAVSRVPTPSSAQPPSAPPQPSSLPEPEPQLQRSNAQRRTQPSPSPSPSSSPSPSRRASRSREADQRAPQLQPSPSRSSTKPPSPARSAPPTTPAMVKTDNVRTTQPTEEDSGEEQETKDRSEHSPTQLPYTSQPETITRQSSSETQTPVEKTPQTELRQEAQTETGPPAEEKISSQPADTPANLESVRTTPNVSLQNDDPSEPMPKTPTQPRESETLPAEIIKEEKAKPRFSQKQDQELSQPPELDDTSEPSLQMKHDIGTSQFNIDEKPKEMHDPKLEKEHRLYPTKTAEPERETKEFDESKPKMKPETHKDDPKLVKEFKLQPTKTLESDRETKEFNESVPKKKPEIHKDDPELVKEHKMQPTKTFESDRETKQFDESVPKMKPETHKDDPKLVKEHKLQPTKTLVSDRETKKFEESIPKMKPETHKGEYPRTGGNEELNKRKEPELSIVVSETKPTSAKELEEPEKTSKKVSRIAISTIPRGQSDDADRANFHKEVKNSLSELVKKLSIGHSGQAGSDQGLSIITLAGQNKGATMVISKEGMMKQFKKSGNEKNIITSDKERSQDTADGQSPLAATVNNNVQSINNSLLKDSSCCEKDPGVHLVLSTKPTARTDVKGRTEALKTQKAASNVSTPQKLSYEPNIRRRCLRGLLMEPSDDDIEDPLKPRRHGCRVSCDEKKKGKVDDDEGTSRH